MADEGKKTVVADAEIVDAVIVDDAPASAGLAIPEPSAPTGVVERVDRAAVEQLKQDLESGRTDMGSQFLGLRENLNTATEQFLGSTEKSGGDEVSKALVDLETQLRHLDPNKFAKRGGVLGFVGKKVMDLEGFFSSFKSVKEGVEGIGKRLDGELGKLGDNQDFLRELYVTTQENAQQLGTMIAAAYELRETPEGREILMQSMGLMDSSDPTLSDYDRVRQEGALDRRLTDMEGVYQVYQQSAVQILNAAHNNMELADGVQRARSDVLSIWNLSLSLAVTNEQQRQTSDVVNTISDMTNGMLAKNSEQLKKNTLAIAEANERPTIDPKVLESGIQNLRETFVGLQGIREKGVQGRALARASYQKAEQGLTELVQAQATGELGSGRSGKALPSKAREALESGPRSPTDHAEREASAEQGRG